VAGVAALILLAGFTTAVSVLILRGGGPRVRASARRARHRSARHADSHAVIAALTGFVVWGSLTHNDLPQHLPADRPSGSPRLSDSRR